MRLSLCAAALTALVPEAGVWCGTRWWSTMGQQMWHISYILHYAGDRLVGSSSGNPSGAVPMKLHCAGLCACCYRLASWKLPIVSILSGAVGRREPIAATCYVMYTQCSLWVLGEMKAPADQAPGLHVHTACCHYYSAGHGEGC